MTLEFLVRWVKRSSQAGGHIGIMVSMKKKIKNSNIISNI